MNYRFCWAWITVMLAGVAATGLGQAADDQVAGKQAAGKQAAEKRGSDKRADNKPADGKPADGKPINGKPIEAVRPFAASEWSVSHARHLLARAGFGGDAAEVQQLYALGLAGAVDRLVDYASEPVLDLPAPSASEPLEPLGNLAKLTPEERQKVNAERRRSEQQRITSTRGWWVRRMVETRRPLEEKMTLFWHGLLTSGFQTVRSANAMYQQNELYRQHATGNYGELLHALLRDPAMLRYLDNSRNVKGRPNENLAREILELFSMGEGNYSEQDIKEAARALTGYTVDRGAEEFRFVSRAHDDGSKTIFGQTGNWNGDQLIDLILQQPATARYIVRKLFVYFVHDAPSEETVDALARVFRDSKYEIAPLLKTMFLSREFYSERAVATHIKSPAELVVGTVRSLKATRVEPQALVLAMRSMGQDLFEPPNVKGWDGDRAWLNSNWLFARQNFAVALVSGAAPGPIGPRRPMKRPAPRANARSPVNLVEFCRGQQLFTTDAVISGLSEALFPVPLTDTERSELLTVLGELPAEDSWSGRESEINTKLRRLVVLMLSMPQYQLS